MKLQDKTQCCGCSACVNVCPAKCISMLADEEGFLYPTIDAGRCIDCGKCSKVCPMNRNVIIEDPLVWAAINIDSAIRNCSSSGGMFYLLAKEVVISGGVVFGAAFDEYGVVNHIGVSTAEELYRIMGSKYSQSHLGNIYSQVKKELENARKVLFSGTPCQVSGLKSFLQKGYDNLYCVDIICHGVPSPAVWKKYVEYREHIANSKVKRFSFRDKTYGWKNYSVSFCFENGTKYLKSHNDDPMMRAFLNGLCLRPYCHQCKFKGNTRDSDITLADFWGIENVMPDFDDDKGASLVFVNTPKGRSILDKLGDKISRRKCELSVVAKYNRSYYYPANLNKQRTSFIKKISSDDFNKTVRKYCDITLLKRINGRICRFFRAK